MWWRRGEMMNALVWLWKLGMEGKVRVGSESKCGVGGKLGGKA